MVTPASCTGEAVASFACVAVKELNFSYYIRGAILFIL